MATATIKTGRHRDPVEYPVTLTAGEFAAVMGVDPKTIYSWARAGKVRYAKTPGGNYRFSKSDVDALRARGAR